MDETIRLRTIPAEEYGDYKYEVIFKAYKWDPQVGDINTVAEHVVLLDRGTAERLASQAESLARETMALEEALIKRPGLIDKLGLPKKLLQALPRASGYERDAHVRLMRFDFHPTATGWAVSEVNSDVPGGLAEASVLPELAGRYFPGCAPYGNVAGALVGAFRRRIKPDGTVALIHATSYADDRQVMQFIGDRFEQAGYRAVYSAPDHIRWSGKRAVCTAVGAGEETDGLLRFFPAEWLVNLPRSSDWRGFFDCVTPSCNHPLAMLAQSKRLPLIWDALDTDTDSWKTLLPDTRGTRAVPRGDDRWIYKPALGRVGEGISIKGAVTERERLQIERMARRSPGDWIAQRKFDSRPLIAEDGTAYHLCLGVFTVDGAFGGFYGRVSTSARIDASALDIAVLVAGEDENNA